MFCASNNMAKPHLTLSNTFDPMKGISICVLALVSSMAIQAQVLTNFTMQEGLLDDNVHAVCAGQGNDLWFGTQSGVSHFDGVEFLDPVTVEDGLVHETVFAVMCDSNGDVWMGTDFGLTRFDGTACVTYTTDDGLEDNRIKHVFEDAEGLIWIGHNDGASSFDGQAFTNYTTADGLPFGGVNHIAQESDGSMWFGTGLGGAFHLSSEGLTGYTSNDGLPNNSVRSIAVDANDQKWVGTNEGVAVLGPGNGLAETHLSLIALPPPHVINPVEDVVLDAEGRVWVGVYVDYLVSVGGVAYFNGAEWVDFSAEEGLAGPNVRQLAVAANGDVWVATSTGLTRFSGTPAAVSSHPKEAWKVYPNPAGQRLRLEAPNAMVDADAEVVLRNALGRKVAHRTVDGFGLDWDVSNLPEGVYLLEVRGLGWTQIQRVILTGNRR